MLTKKQRCTWCYSVGEKDQEGYLRYHDEEWGVPLHEEHRLFEMLILEGVQAGLSWATVLRKREAYRKAYAHFDVNKVAAYGDKEKEQLLANAGLVRNRLKINASILNARAFIKIQEEFGSFDSYIWHFVGGRPLQNHWKSHEDIPAYTPLSDKISKALKGRGFKFVGSTICYAFMQAVGMVNDHTVDCFRYGEVQKEQGIF